MELEISLMSFFKDGDFSLGISGNKVFIDGIKVDEFTKEPVSEDLYSIGEAFCLTIGLFIIEIKLYVGRKIYEGEPRKIKDYDQK